MTVNEVKDNLIVPSCELTHPLQRQLGRWVVVPIGGTCMDMSVSWRVSTNSQFQFGAFTTLRAIKYPYPIECQNNSCPFGQILPKPPPGHPAWWFSKQIPSKMLPTKNSRLGTMGQFAQNSFSGKLAVKPPYPWSVSVAHRLISWLLASPRGVHRLRDALSEPEVNITENEVAKGGSGGMEANGPCLLVCRLSFIFI